MAKGQKIGSLFYDIDGDNREALKKLEQVKKEAVSIQKIMQDVMKSKGQVSASQLGNEARRNALNQARIDEIANRSTARQQILQQQLAREVLRTEQLRQRMLNQSISSQNGLNNSIGLTNKTMFSQKNLLQQLSSAMGIYFSIYQAGSFVRELAMVSGEFEKQRVSLAAIIGDAGAASKIFNQIKDLAVISPFNFKELTDYAKQLSAFSIPTSEIFDTTKRLADLSAGLGVDMSRIILAYGQVRSAAVLRGQELRQFTEAGIPLVDELAKKFGELEGRVVSVGEVFDKISNREASFGMVKEIIDELTSEGGKFFEMQEIQSATLAGKISNLRDNYDMMLDSLGKANSGLLHGTMDGLVNVLDNWEKYFAVLTSIVAAYGAYKAIVIASSIATNGLTASIKGCTAAQALFNSVSKLNPYGLLAAGIGAVISGLISFSSAQKKANEELYKSIGVINDQKESVNKLIDRLKELTNQAEDDVKAQVERNNIIEKLSKTEPILASYIRDHATSLNELTKAQKEYNDLMDAQKLAEYLINDSSGFFNDGIIDDLEDLTKVQNRLAASTSGIQITYTKLVEEFNKINELGGVKTPLGIRKFNEELLREINAIIASEKTKSDKLEEVYKLLDPDKRWRSGTNSSTLESSVGERIFGTAASGKYADYVRAMGEVKVATNEAHKELDSLSDGIVGFLNNTDSGTDKLNKLKDQFKNIAGISYSEFLKKDEQNQLKYLNDDIVKLVKNIQDGESKLRNLVNNIQGLNKYGKEYILTKWDIEINGSKDFETPLSGWRKEIQDIVGSTIVISAESNLNEVIKEMEDEYKTLRTRIEEQKPILIKYGFDFDTGQFKYPATPAITQLGENFKADTLAVEALTKGLDVVGKKANEVFKQKGGSQKDAFAEALKKRVDLLKDVKSEYDKLVKAGMSEDDSAKYLMGLGSFKGIDARTYNDEIDKIIKELQSKKKLSEQGRSLLESLILGKDKDNISETGDRIAKEAKSSIEKIEKELSKYKDQYSLYETIFGITGDKGQAAKLAFGDSSIIVKSFRDKLKEELDRTADPELKKKLQEQLTDIEWSDTADFSKQMAELVKKYQTVEEQIATVRENGERKRLEILKNADNASEELLQKRLKANQEAINEEVAELTNGVLQSTESYQRLFGDLSEISTREVKYLIEKWNNAINNATKKADGSVSINIDDTDYPTTEKELASFSKRMIALDKELRDRNPFKALIDSINALKKNKAETTKIENEIQELENTKLTADRSEIPTIDANISKLKKNLSDLKAKGATDLQLLGVAFSSVASDVSNLASSISSMFEAFGDEKTADTIGFIGELASSLGDIGQGISSGNYVQAAQGIIGSITSIVNFHDKRLDRAIKRSQLEVKKLQNAYREVERIISRQLGAITDKQSKELIANQEKQIKELEKQVKAEWKKKNTDRSVILDLEDQIAEAKDKLLHFYEDLADKQWDINVKTWAGQLSDALINAFASGESAAKAFDSTVADIMKNVIKNMINLSVLVPAMENLRNKLFGDDGKSGLLGDGKPELNKETAAAIVGELAILKDKIGEAKDIWDYLNNAAKEAGINLENVSEKDTLSKGIQSLSEDTGSLLGAYLNAMRADLSAQRQLVSTLIQLAQINSGTFANMYAELVRIQINTLATANNTARLVELSENTNSILRSVTTNGSGYSVNI